MQHPPAPTVSPTRRSASPAHSANAVGAASLPVEALDYHLPADRIATHPAEPRDAAKMLVLKRSDASFIEHRHVRDLPEYLRAGDALVFNTTAVAPARLELQRASGGRVEGLYLETVAATAGAIEWIVMLRSGGRLAIGERLSFLDREDRASDFSLRILGHEGDQWRVAIDGGVSASTLTQSVLDLVGRTPLPPYIRKARTEHHESFADADDQRWYQTVYADASHRQSVAAPTAGLHFTPELLERIAGMGVERIDVTLHVGPGTFKPVTAATLAEHRMHSEELEVSAQAIAALKRIRARDHNAVHPHPRPLSHKERGERIIAVGTTSVRTLESIPESAIAAESCGGIRGSTDLMIAPPHEFRLVDGMLTNFHLPRSTLLALVAAMVGLDRLLHAYREAVGRGYRFYSYGDAMLILP